MRRALETGEREFAGTTLPPGGLYLNEVFYNEPQDNTNELLGNLDKLHTTQLGEQRIQKNLELDVDDVVEWARAQIGLPSAVISRVGKNFQIMVGDISITVNAGSYTIITAHKK